MACLSRFVSCVRPQLSSMNRSTLENSPSSLLTRPCFAYGLITSIGTRIPNPKSSTCGGGTWS